MAGTGRRWRAVAALAMLAAALPAGSGRQGAAEPVAFEAAAALVRGPAEVSDGDTLRIGAQRIRLFGIDAPEARQTCDSGAKGSWPCGAAATARLRALIGDGKVTCRPRDRDRYGRLVATCTVGRCPGRLGALRLLHLTALVTVDRATRANGCLEMATDFRGSHQLIGREWEPLTETQLAGVHWMHIEAEPGDAVFFDSFVPHRSAPNTTAEARRVLYYTYNKASEGDHLAQYYADKRASYPPDIEREPGREYRYRV